MQPTDTTNRIRPLDLTHELAMRELATLAARWSADPRVQLLSDGRWWVRVVTSREIIAADSAGTFTDAVARCLTELQRVTAEEDAREAAGEVTS